MIKVKLLSDVTEMIRHELKARGDKNCDTEAFEKMFLKWSNFVGRKVPIQKWKIEISEHLQSRELPDNIRQGLDHFTLSATTGQNLNPHLTKFTKKVEAFDALHSEWGIVHFHLGTTLEANGFIERTNDTLFAFPKDDTLYCIDILPHGNFENTNLLEILNQSWPEILASYRINGVLPPEKKLTVAEIKKLRRAGVNSFVGLDDGTTIMGPGGGVSVNSYKINYVMEAMRFKVRMQNAEANLRKEEFQIRKKLRRRLGREPKEVKFSIHKILENQLLLIEENTRLPVSIAY